MHQYDQFKQDMEKLHKADLQNPIMANRSEPDKPNSDSFMWIGPDGVRHNEGLRWPTMRIEQNCTVEVLTDEYGRDSKGWYKQHGEDT